MLTQAEQHRIYERIPPEKPYGSLRNLLLAEIGVDATTSIDEVKARRERLKELPASQAQGGDRKSEISTSGSEVDIPHYTSTAGIVRRLKRDAPELADRVIDGEISAAAAAKQAGFKWAQRRAINLEDAASANTVYKVTTVNTYATSLLHYPRYWRAMGIS